MSPLQEQILELVSNQAGGRHGWTQLFLKHPLLLPSELFILLSIYTEHNKDLFFYRGRDCDYIAYTLQSYRRKHSGKITFTIFCSENTFEQNRQACNRF